MSEGEEEIPTRLTNVELAKIVKEQVADNKKLRASLEQRDKENAEKDRLIKSMLERLLALEKKDKSIKLDEEIRDEEDKEEPKKEEDAEEVRIGKLEKSIRNEDRRVRTDLPIYGGKMDDEELIDWFCAMENFFECEGIEEKEKVKIAKSRLKGHTFLWWDCIQADRWKNGKPKITS